MFFKRKDGQIDKSVDIFERIMPIIMKERNDALVYIKKEVPLDGMNEYIKKKKQEGIDISHMEIIFTALARVIKEKPKLNRFIISSEIYNRNDIEILREKKLKEKEQYENDKKEISRNYILQTALNRENREKEKEQEDKSQEKTNNSNNVGNNIEKNQKQSVGKSNGSSNMSISSNTIEKKTGTDKEKKHIFGRMPYGKEVPVVKVKGIHENLGDIIIVGEIIDKEIREIREDLSLASYAVYDGTSSIMVKKFLKKEEIEDVEKRIKEHMSQDGLFKIYGKPRI